MRRTVRSARVSRLSVSYDYGLTKNVNIDKYKYSGCRIVFDRGNVYLLPNGNFGRNVIIFGIVMSLSDHADKKGKNILIFEKVQRKG